MRDPLVDSESHENTKLKAVMYMQVCYLLEACSVLMIDSKGVDLDRRGGGKSWQERREGIRRHLCSTCRWDLSQGQVIVWVCTASELLELGKVFK